MRSFAGALQGGSAGAKDVDHGRPEPKPQPRGNQDGNGSDSGWALVEEGQHEEGRDDYDCGDDGDGGDPERGRLDLRDDVRACAQQLAAKLFALFGIGRDQDGETGGRDAKKATDLLDPGDLANPDVSLGLVGDIAREDAVLEAERHAAAAPQEFLPALLPVPEIGPEAARGAGEDGVDDREGEAHREGATEANAPQEGDGEEGQNREKEIEIHRKFRGNAVTVLRHAVDSHVRES